MCRSINGRGRPMATSKGVSCPFSSISRCEIQLRSEALRVLLIVCTLLACVSAMNAQSPPQQYVYASASSSTASSVLPGFSKAGQTGALNLIPGSPFNERFGGGLIAIDGQAKFLFVLNPALNDISMFQINRATGALSEVPASIPGSPNDQSQSRALAADFYRHRKVGKIPLRRILHG